MISDGDLGGAPASGSEPASGPSGAGAGPLHWLWLQLVFLPTLGWNVLLGRVLRLRHWWDRVDDHVVLGALPFSRDVPRLAELGVTGVVNTCREYPGPRRAYQEAGIEQVWIPTSDYTPPTLGDIDRALELMRRVRDEGRSTYVHCKAGRARSATVVMCWLIETQGMTPEQAQARLIAVRPHVNRRLVQRQVIQDFYQRQLQRRPPPP